MKKKTIKPTPVKAEKPSYESLENELRLKTALLEDAHRRLALQELDESIPGVQADMDDLADEAERLKDQLFEANQGLYAARYEISVLTRAVANLASVLANASKQ